MSSNDNAVSVVNTGRIYIYVIDVNASIINNTY